MSISDRTVQGEILRNRTQALYNERDTIGIRMASPLIGILQVWTWRQHGDHAFDYQSLAQSSPPLMAGIVQRPPARYLPHSCTHTYVRQDESLDTPINANNAVRRTGAIGGKLCTEPVVRAQHVNKKEGGQTKSWSKKRLSRLIGSFTGIEFSQFPFASCTTPSTRSISFPRPGNIAEP